MAKKTKLELTWIGKEDQPRLEPRVLLEDARTSYHAPTRVSESDFFDNRLIFGDNLLALKAMEQEWTGRIKCIYIDPPYNTGAAFEQYDDGVEHSLWLTLIKERLEILYQLLATDGSLWISIDDNEAAYLRVLLDEIFGRFNFVTSVIWEKRKSRENRRVFSFKHDYVIVFAKDRKAFEAVRNPLPLSQEVLARYRNPDNDPRGPWQSISALAQAGHATPSQFYTLTTPSGRQIDPADGNCWRYTKGRMEEEMRAGRIWFGTEGNNAPRIKRYLRENPDDGLTPETIWYADDVGTNDSAKRGLTELFGGQVVFDTPKPEGLIQRVIHIATNPGDWVLDSFAGSGTTAAVAQKMARKWIAVELGQHCDTVIVPRLKKVIDGLDPGGITGATEWKGGGGFRYYTLAPSLLQQDQFDNWIINKQYNAPMLAQAICKIEGFVYAPSDAVYWQQGHSTESDFIYVTTQTLTRQQIEALAEEVGPKRSLVIYCHAFRVKNVDDFPNLTLKKIPKAVLAKCEWGKDDYSLEIKQLKSIESEPEPSDPEAPPPRRRRRLSADQQTLFTMQGGEQ